MANRHLPASEQRQDTLYEMKMLFNVDLEPKEINDLTEMCGFSEKMVLQNAKTVELTQTQPFIPNEEDIQKYVEAIMNTYDPDGTTKIGIHACRFVGYEYIYVVKPDTSTDTNNPT